MIITRKIGSLIRGRATPFQLYAACTLGALLGFLPGFQQAPGLMLIWSFLLLILNANLFLAGIVTLLSKLIFLLAMPVIFQLGRLLLEGPTQGIFKSMINAPVLAYSGFDYYVVAGGQLVAVAFGLTLGTLMTRALYSYRRKMHDLSEKSERLKKYSERPWAKTMKFLFLGSGRGKESYEALMARKIGNPIRIWGLAVVLVMVGLLAIGLRTLSEPLLTSVARSQLEAANGATVDLESVDFSLREGKVEALGLAMTDPQDLNTNFLEARRVVADVSAADLLRKRFSVDLLTIEDGATATGRESPGALVGPKPDTDSKIQLPEFQDLEGILKNSKEWKERLSQAKRWLDRFGSDEDPEEQKVSWESELNSRIRSLGHAHVKADFLTEGSPTFWIRRMEAMGVKTPYLDNAVVDIVGENLSTHPSLAGAAPTLSIVSRDNRLDAKLSLAGASGTGTNETAISVKDYPVDQFAQSLKSDGQPPLSGGSMDIGINGRIGSLDNDLVAIVNFQGTTARIAGNPINLDGVSLPINIRGPLDRPGIKVESDAFEKLLVSAGKKKLLDRAVQELGGDADSEAEGEQKPKDLLKGFLKKKLEEE